MSALPAGWSRSPIRDVCELINGRAFKPTDWTKAGLPIVRIQNLNDSSKPYNRYDGEVDPRFLIDSEELLFAWSGTPGTSFGAHIWRGGKAVLNQHIFRVVPNASIVDKYFLRLAINERLLHLIGAAHGGAGLAHVTKPVFEATEVALPPLDQQRRIVEKIEALTAKSRRAKETLDSIPPLLERFRQSVLAAAFRGDLTKDWREQHPDVEPADQLLARIRQERRHRWEQAQLEKLQAQGKEPKNDDWKKKYVEPEPVDAEGLPELPAGWCWESLDGVTDVRVPIAYGIVQPGPDTPGGIPVIRAQDIADGRVLQANLRLAAPRIAAAYPRTRLSEGDVLLCIIRELRVAVVPCGLGGANIVRGIVRLAPSAAIGARWLADWLASPGGQAILRGMYRGMDMPVINVGDVRRTPVPVAPLVEQQQIAGTVEYLLRSAREVSSAVGSGLEVAQALDSSILAKAFRGELVDPTDD